MVKQVIYCHCMFMETLHIDIFRHEIYVGIVHLNKQWCIQELNIITVIIYIIVIIIILR